MGLSQSLYTALTGLQTHQNSIDNLGYNLSNVNTVGFKKNEFHFSSLFSQTMTAAIEASGNRGTTNPISLGMGVTTGAITTNVGQGTFDITDNPLDVAINGGGFFVVSTSRGIALTRDGSFYLDNAQANGQRLLCVGDGLPVQGWMAENGVINPSANTAGNIYLPSIGDILAGQRTSQVTLTGILPTNTSSSEFAGKVTTDLALKGNLTENNNSVTSYIYMPVSTSDGSRNGEVERIEVRIVFSGPTLSEDGSAEVYNWTMQTVDWPNPGDEPIQIYPTADDPLFTQGLFGFYTQNSIADEHGAGQATASSVAPGSASVTTTTTGADGSPITISFTIPADFSLDVSRLTSLNSAPGGNELTTWSVNGNPTGTIARTITVYDEYTDFVVTTDVNGNQVVEAVRRVMARDDVLHFERIESDGEGTTWSWHASAGDTGGTLRFDTSGDLVESTGGGGSVAYDFSSLRHINYDASISVTGQDGFVDGYLTDISIDQYGRIYGRYSNGVADPLAQLAMGTVTNTSGLDGASGTLFYANVATGDIRIGIPGDVYGSIYGLDSIGAGLLRPGALENSNVDLAQEFTAMISIERAYQLISRVVTASDEMLQTALNTKR